MSGEDLSPEPRAAVRVVRPGGNAGGPAAPPMPVVPPHSLPPWLDALGPDATAAGPAGSAGSAPGGSTGTARGSGTASSSGTGTGPGSGTGSAGDPDEELTAEQREVRELLHRAVGGITPAPGALDQLRRAVPRRQRRRRRMAGSVAATVLLCSFGVLALHTAGMSIDSADGAQAGQHYGDAAGNGAHPGGGASGSPGLAPVGAAPGAPPGVGSSFADGGRGRDSASLLPGASGVLQPPPSITRPPGTSGAPPSSGHATGSPGSGAPAAECTRAQLGGGTDTVGSPDAAGVVYGTFQVVNVSASSCTVSTPGAVSVLAVSGTDKSWVSVTQHTAGDPAGGLPQPTATPSPVVLAPGGSYLVEFAWVPASGPDAPSCLVTSASASTDPSPGPGSAVSTTGPGSSSAGGGGSAASALPPSVTLGHTPGSGGAAAASAVIGNACAGTVYRTDPLPGG